MNLRIPWSGLYSMLMILLLSPGQVLARQGTTHPEDPASFLLRGNQAYQDGSFQDALVAYEDLLQRGFESADLYYNMGNTYFKIGRLGPSILNFHRALDLRPRDPDATANLELAQSLTADEIEPLPRFWLLSALSWWVRLLPRGGLILTVVGAYLLVAMGLCLRILSRVPKLQRVGNWVMLASGVALLLFGSTLLAREGILGGSDRGVIMVEEVAVQSAPSQEDDLTLFHVHEGTTVRLDQHTEGWAEIVLEDGRVGWIPSGTLEII